MPKYEVLEECEVLGATQAVGGVHEIEEADADPLVEAGKLKLVEEAV